MNKKIIYLLILTFFNISCEDVIDVNLNTIEPKLVIDASLNWLKGTQGNTQFIQLTLTAPYFNKDIPPATGAIVTVSDSNNNTFNFTEQDNTGIYKNESFIPSINNTYTLTIDYKNEIYIATETLNPVASIDFVEQKNDGGFSGDDIEIKTYYTDPEGVQNFYLFEYISPENNTFALEIYDDEFTDGNQIFGFLSDETLESGNELIIKISSISERTFNYLTILLQQTDDENGDTFQTQPAIVRGNCMNQTNPDNYPLGYFRVSESHALTYIIK